MFYDNSGITRIPLFQISQKILHDDTPLNSPLYNYLGQFNESVDRVDVTLFLYYMSSVFQIGVAPVDFVMLKKCRGSFRASVVSTFS